MEPDGLWRQNGKPWLGRREMSFQFTLTPENWMAWLQVFPGLLGRRRMPLANNYWQQLYAAATRRDI